MIADHITDLIGNTPLLRIAPEIHGIENVDLYAKLEMMNPMGSVKDRVAWGMIKDDIEDIRAGNKTIIENSSGNTAKALQGIAASYGIPFRLVTAMAKVPEVKDILRLMGGEIEEITNATSNCFDPTDPNDPQYYIEKAVREGGEKIYFPSQFTNTKNPAVHYNGTGAEILRDLGHVDYLIGGLGTTGTTLGTSTRLKEANPDLKCVGVCADKSDFIPGIRTADEMWEVGLFSKSSYDQVLSVNSGDSIDAMTRLIRSSGLLCGPSSGANFLGALTYLQSREPFTERKTAVFIVCDRVEWYLSYIRARRPALFGQKLKPGSFRAWQQRAATIDAQAIVPLERAAAWIESARPLLIDTRSNMGFKAISIPGSINIPGDAFELMIDGNRPFPPEQPVLLVCPIGEKSATYATYLRLQACDAYSLELGLTGWRNFDLPLRMDEAA